MGNKERLQQEKMDIKLLESSKQKKTPIRDYITTSKHDKELNARLLSIETTLSKHNKEIDLIERILMTRSKHK